MPSPSISTSSAPFEGLSDKISQIQRFYRESLSYADVRALAESLAFNAGDELDIKSFFSRLKDLVRYLPDPTGAELIKAPWVMVDDILNGGKATGDCDDFATLAYALLHSVGIDAELYVGWYNGASPLAVDDPSHIFCGVPQKDGTWAAFDLVAKEYGQTLPGLSGIMLGSQLSNA